MSVMIASHALWGAQGVLASMMSVMIASHALWWAQGVLASMKALMEGFGPMAFAWMLPRWEVIVVPGG